MKHVVLVLAAALGSVLMLGAVPAPDAKGGVVSTAPPAITLAFNHRVMPRPLIRPPYPRPVPFRRPVYHRPAVTVIAPPPPPPVVVAPPASRPVRHVTLPLAEPVLVEQPGSGYYETRLRIAPSGERYEERVWVPSP